jgi:F420-dependent oxidoreductase-like protein
VQLRIFTEPQQGATYEQLLTVALATEGAGLNAFFRSDHYLFVDQPPVGPTGPLPGPSDAWITLAGLARDTTSIRLGTLLSPATFRLPGPLAISVAQVDAMSGGRVELGLGAGWYAEEHEAYGIPFPDRISERLDRLEEQLTIINGLWKTPVGDRFSYAGAYYRCTDSPALPKPVQTPRPPIIVGGRGTRRLPVLAAKYADECNVSFATLEQFRAVMDALDDACERSGRDPRSVVRSFALTLCMGEDENAYNRRALAMRGTVDQLRVKDAVGTPADVASLLGKYAAMGASRAYLQILDLSDLEHIALVGQELAPLVANL